MFYSKGPVMAYSLVTSKLSEEFDGPKDQARIQSDKTF